MLKTKHYENHNEKAKLESNSGFVLEYVGGSGDTIARDYFGTYEEAKEMYDDVKASYIADGPSAMALNIINEETDETIDSWEW